MRIATDRGLVSRTCGMPMVSCLSIPDTESGIHASLFFRVLNKQQRGTMESIDQSNLRVVRCHPILP
ncbi:uncharacterized protein EKO05_0002161 [Ascochyta rabiei]|uniref:uncharacterized protein n=1 Tax=Didymella rabiei TaxID=5454 RepID=UPI002200F8A0|nr:uncharacterized protein EKO05_0002161 [Ascochyta rabiei]UPX11562.1 hypothetical protein EKO05_0002161 [Ascochyta rabiei]